MTFLASSSSMRIFTGIALDDLHELPTAFSGGSRLMRDPVEPAMESTWPFSTMPFMSTLISTSWPGFNAGELGLLEVGGDPALMQGESG